MVSAPRLILASASPRRKELLSRLGIAFTVVPSGISEQVPPGPPRDGITALALAKARAVSARIPSGVVLGVDTDVVLDGAVLGKPSGREDARRMLRALRGRAHEVITGLALVEAPTGRTTREAVVTEVWMKEYDEAAIDAYLGTAEPFDKAGAYGVQGLGGTLVAKVDGCYTNVVGLPLGTTRRLLEAWGLL